MIETREQWELAQASLKNWINSQLAVAESFELLLRIAKRANMYLKYGEPELADELEEALAKIKAKAPWMLESE